LAYTVLVWLHSSVLHFSSLLPALFVYVLLPKISSVYGSIIIFWFTVPPPRLHLLTRASLDLWLNQYCTLVFRCL
jgi:hypothetical protein